MDSLNQEIRTALVVNIPNYKQVGYVFYYSINLSKMYSGEQANLEKRFSQFYALNEALRLKGCMNLPRMPPKTLLPLNNHEGLERRR